MQYDTLQLAALAAAGLVVIAREQTRWIQGVGIGQLLVALLLMLMAADFLRLPIRNVQLVLAFVVCAGWVTVLALGKSKPTLIAGAVGAWISLIMTLTELGWVRLDPLRRLLRF